MSAPNNNTLPIFATRTTYRNKKGITTVKSEPVSIVGKRFPESPEPIAGVGTNLKRILKRFGINADEAGCKCNSRAAMMKRNVPQRCKDNMATIVGWLEEEANRRNLPFSRFGARQIVRLAISLTS